mmetsp:Transcript_39979/g.76467  ORF Transcript_39979/g.76467 Transcript_39979/m.76467 type:complete len:341 (+) Transcript_39979:608-1630(+)
MSFLGTLSSLDMLLCMLLTQVKTWSNSNSSVTCIEIHRMHAHVVRSRTVEEHAPKHVLQRSGYFDTISMFIFMSYYKLSFKCHTTIRKAGARSLCNGSCVDKLPFRCKSALGGEKHFRLVFTPQELGKNLVAFASVRCWQSRWSNLSPPRTYHKCSQFVSPHSHTPTCAGKNVSVVERVMVHRLSGCGEYRGCHADRRRSRRVSNNHTNQKIMEVCPHGLSLKPDRAHPIIPVDLEQPLTACVFESYQKVAMAVIGARRAIRWVWDTEATVVAIHNLASEQIRRARALLQESPAHQVFELAHYSWSLHNERPVCEDALDALYTANAEKCTHTYIKSLSGD